MTMDQEKQPHIYHSAEESPVPVPPVEEGWSMMKQQLDIHQPVTGSWAVRWTGRWAARLGRPALLIGAAAVLVTGILVFWPGARHRTGKASPEKAAISSHTGSTTSTRATQNNPTTGGTAANGSTINTHPADNTHPSNGNTATPITGSDNVNSANTGTHPANTTGTHPITSADAQPSTTRPNTTTGTHSTPGHTNPRNTNPGETTPGETLARETVNNHEPNHNRSTNHNRKNLNDQNPTYSTYNQKADHSRPNQTTYTTGRDRTNRTTNHPTNHSDPNQGTNPNQGNSPNQGNNPNQTTQTTNPATHSRAPGSTRRWTPSPTKLARTNPPAPKFIPVADSLLRAIHSASKTATAAAPKKKNRQTGLALAAGISLGQSIPIGQQQLSSYNLLSDYIPSPYLRLYMGDRWYLQITPHLLSAQYTPSQLIDSSGGDTSRIPGYPQYLQYNKVTLKKLYYTDIPLTINYRVFKGFYLGAGIQYSRLWQAAAEDRITLHPSNGFGNDTLFSSKTISLKNKDSAFSRLARSDWRLLLEADYVWRRFTFGLQYQLGLNTYLPMNPSGSKGTDKNSSFSIHIYYEIWNQRRKNN